MENRKINVLVITKSSWSDTNALGNTLSNFFSNWNGFSFNNIYFQEEIADNGVCNNYLQFSEGQLVRKITKNVEFGLQYYCLELKESLQLFEGACSRSYQRPVKHAVFLPLYLAVFPCIAACRDCGGNSPALVIEGTTVPEHDVYPADGGADVRGIVYVAAGLGYLPSLYMATEAETRTGHNSNRNQQ